MSKMKQRVSTTIRVDNQIWVQARIEAIKRGITVSELIEKAIQKYLKEGEKQ